MGDCELSTGDCSPGVGSRIPRRGRSASATPGAAPVPAPSSSLGSPRTPREEHHDDHDQPEHRAHDHGTLPPRDTE
ncbi:MAG: hypothetical protein U5R31_00785 [Acidimicrobiia bacterium]|nr:hypothetical protein [Acidimicrobiia bacterium]